MITSIWRIDREKTGNKKFEYRTKKRRQHNQVCCHYKSSVLNQFLWIDEMDQLKIYNSTKRSCIMGSFEDIFKKGISDNKRR